MSITSCLIEMTCAEPCSGKAILADSYLLKNIRRQDGQQCDSDILPSMQNPSFISMPSHDSSNSPFQASSFWNCGFTVTPSVIEIHCTRSKRALYSLTRHISVTSVTTHYLPRISLGMSPQSGENIGHELSIALQGGNGAAPDSTKIPSVEPEIDQYARFSAKRKAIITALASLGAFLPPISSTMIASALPEVAGEFSTSGSVANSTNALYLLAAGISPCFVGPLSSLYGRRPVS